MKQIFTKFTLNNKKNFSILASCIQEKEAYIILHLLKKKISKFVQSHIIFLRIKNKNY